MNVNRIVAQANSTSSSNVWFKAFGQSLILNSLCFDEVNQFLDFETGGGADKT